MPSSAPRWRDSPLRNLPPSARASQFGNPLAQSHYLPHEQAAFANALRASRIPLGLDASGYHQLSERMMGEIRATWAQADPPVRFLVDRCLKLLAAAYPIEGVKPRRDGTPALFHPLWVMHAASQYGHFDAVLVCAAALHDVFEDSAARPPSDASAAPPIIAKPFGDANALHLALVAACPLQGLDRAQSVHLARAVVWDVLLLTNDPADFPGPRLRQPSDLHDTRLIQKLEDKLRYYRAYLSRLYDAPLLDGVLVKSLDSLHNLSTLAALPPEAFRPASDFLEKAFITCVKENEHIDLDRKLYYTIPYLALEAQGRILAALGQAHPDLAEALDPIRMSRAHANRPEFRYSLYRDLQYYTWLKSDDQLFFEHMRAIFSKPRSDMGAELIRQQPYAVSDRAVVTLQAPEIRDVHNLAYVPITIQVPGRLLRSDASGDPGVPAHFLYTDPIAAQSYLHARLDGLGFGIRSAPSLFPGPIQADFQIYELSYAGEIDSLLAYFGSTPLAQMEGYRRLRETLLGVCAQMPLDGSSPLVRSAD